MPTRIAPIMNHPCLHPVGRNIPGALPPKCREKQSLQDPNFPTRGGSDLTANKPIGKLMLLLGHHGR